MNTTFFQSLRKACCSVALEHARGECLHIDLPSIELCPLSRPFSFIATFNVMTQGGFNRVLSLNVEHSGGEDVTVVSINGAKPVKVGLRRHRDPIEDERKSRPPSQQSLIEAATLANWHKDHRCA